MFTLGAGTYGWSIRWRVDNVGCLDLADWEDFIVLFETRLVNSFEFRNVVCHCRFDNVDLASL
jgi:hypothetical protein